MKGYSHGRKWFYSGALCYLRKGMAAVWQLNSSSHYSVKGEMESVLGSHTALQASAMACGLHYKWQWHEPAVENKCCGKKHEEEEGRRRNLLYYQTTAFVVVDAGCYSIQTMLWEGEKGKTSWCDMCLCSQLVSIPTVQIHCLR